MDQQSRDPIGEITISKAKRAGRIIYGQPSGSWQKRSKKNAAVTHGIQHVGFNRTEGHLEIPKHFFQFLYVGGSQRMRCLPFLCDIIVGQYTVFSF